MAGGLPQPAIFNIPVKQVAIEIYGLMWVHRRRIAGWAVFPLILCTVLVLVRNQGCSTLFTLGDN